MRVQIIAFCIFIVACDSENNEKVFFESGQLYQEYEIKDNMKHGSFVEYYANGNIAEKSKWFDGKRNGLSEQLHENGKLKFKGYFESDRPIDTLFFFNEQEKMIEWQFYKRGKMIEFCKYKNDGDIKEESREAVFYAENDTIEFGQTYTVEIRLGSRKYDRVRVIIGSRFDENNFLTDTTDILKDSIGVIRYSVLSDKKNKNKIFGYIEDVKVIGDSAIVDTMPFVHEYFVR